MNRNRRLIRCIAFATWVSCLASGTGAGETGGTPDRIQYGPDPHRTIDERNITCYVSPAGDDANDGKTRQTALRTIQKAIDGVQPGGTVLVLKGVYRDGFWINKQGRPDAWISIVAEPGAEIRGSDVVTTWEKVPDAKYAIYRIPRPKLSWQRPELPLANRTEQVFVNGQLLNQVIDMGMLKPRGMFYVDDETETLYVCLKDERDPNVETTEVTYRTWAIAVGGRPNQHFWHDDASHAANRASYVRIDGFTIRHIGCWARQAAIQIRGTCSHIIVENCDVQWANSYGIAAGSVKMFSKDTQTWLEAPCTDIILRHNIMSNCGIGGGGGGASRFVIEKNIMDHNNYKGVSPWAEGGAFKTGFTCSDIVIRHNIARNNNNHGLWFDYGATGCVFENNFVYKSFAGGILNEVTPAPDRIYTPAGQKELKTYTLEELKRYKGQGTIIRNNVVVGTMGYGSGIGSASPNGMIYNNIIAGCSGAALNVGAGGTQRKGVLGNFNNRIFSNITYDNVACAAVSAEDESTAIFNNVVSNNLFLNWRDQLPVKIDKAWADEREFERVNRGATNYFHKTKNLFRNPDRFDFTITDPDLAAKIGFKPAALRLDWSEFYVEEEAASALPDANLEFRPIDLGDVLNRALEDEVADDGKGGWTDQGPNDMSRLPVGRQSISGVPFLIGSKDKGALFLKNERMREGAAFPEAVSIPIRATFDTLYFLYGAAWSGDRKQVDGKMVAIQNGECGRFIIRYADGTQAARPLEYGRHILDWRDDPTSDWQKCATLNDNGVYVAWQGPNRQAGSVTTYYLKWNNPDPEKTIDSVTISREEASPESAFFLLGLTGANDAAKGEKSDKVFTMDFDGNIDALDAYGRELQAQGVDTVAFKAARFADGVKGKGIIPAQPLYYPMPRDFPFDSGTVSLWLKADDYLTDERVAQIRKDAYTSGMWPLTASFSGRDGKDSAPRRITCFLRFKVDLETRNLLLESHFGSVVVNEPIGSLIKPDAWFNVTVTWERAGNGDTSTQKVFINGALLAEKKGRYYGAALLARDQLIVGVPGNRGQPWRGTIDELTIWDRPLADAEIASVAAGCMPPSRRPAEGREQTAEQTQP